MDGWEVRQGSDGFYLIYAVYNWGVLAFIRETEGPFVTRDAALAALHAKYR